MDLTDIYKKLRGPKKKAKKRKKRLGGMEKLYKLNPKGILGGESKRQRLLRETLKD